MSNILYIARCAPDEGASGTRIGTIANLLKLYGHKVLFLVNRFGLCNNTEENVFTIRDYSYFNQLINLLDIVNGRTSFNCLKNISKIYKPNVIIVYNQPFSITKKIIRYSKKYNIRVFIDSTEWYEQNSIIHGISNYIFRKSVDKRIRIIDKESDGVIAISNFLEQYYKHQHIRVLNIPPLMNISVHQSSYHPNKNIRLIYAGSPGTKDILVPIINTLIKYNSISKRKIELDIYGIDNNYINKLVPGRQFPMYGVKAHGFKARSEIIEQVSQSDFSILFRYPLRYAKAGYSTKMAESLSLGTPILCNKVGGSDLDIIDGVTGFVIENYEEDTLLSIFDKLNSLSKDYLQTMRAECIKFSTKRYSAIQYAERLNEFISK